MNFGHHLLWLLEAHNASYLPLVHLFSLYPCAPLLFSSWLLSYSHPSPRITACQNKTNQDGVEKVRQSQFTLTLSSYCGEKMQVTHCRQSNPIHTMVNGLHTS